MSAERRLYLLDVEGTVAPISLVTEQLFPYARAHFAIFLKENAGNPEVESDLALLAEENRAETEADVPGMLCLPEGVRRGGRVEGSAVVLSPEGLGLPADALAYLLWLMDRDRKSTALKSLQGKIWKAGFESGELKSTLFPTCRKLLPAGPFKAASPFIHRAQHPRSNCSSAIPSSATLPISSLPTSTPARARRPQARATLPSPRPWQSSLIMSASFPM